MQFEGRLVRIAHVDGEGYQFLDDPDAAVGGTAQIRNPGWTFSPSSRSCLKPRRSTASPWRWDNIAALPVSTFDHWMSHQIDFKVRNKVRKAAKNGGTSGKYLSMTISYKAYTPSTMSPPFGRVKSFGITERPWRPCAG